MSQSNVSKWVRLLLEILTKALAAQQLLPARTAQELAAYLQTDAPAFVDGTDERSSPPFLP